ncbi:MAG: NB-ARC domain-containing protein [Anaerolineae bacterium]|nr:NB-ARC domain-containing protein [Anaerolineae bacterium]
MTCTKVKQALRAIARADIAPDLLPAVFEMRGVTQTPIERTRWLRDYLADLILARLHELRGRTPISRPVTTNDQPAYGNRPPVTDHADAMSALAHDFAQGNSELEAWSALYHRYLTDMDMSVGALAAAAHISERHFRRRVEAGIRLLTEQLRLTELAARGRLRRLHLDRYLPPPDYLRLFGIQELVANAIRLLTDPDGPGIIAFEGMGGIGKTTLAQVIAQRLAENGPFAAILWISAQQRRLLTTGLIEPLPAPTLTFTDLLLHAIRQLGRDDLLAADAIVWEKTLQTLFHDEPHLIIVDNLETMADQQALVPRLRRMLGPSRAILTSRQSLRNYPFVQVFPVPPLSLTDSIALVRSELTRVGRWPDPAEQSRLEELCALAGGLPLALKLIAGLLIGGAAIPRIRAELLQAGGVASALYTYIYRHTWFLLSENARRLLIDMLLIAPDGEDLAWLEATSTLPAEPLRQALTELSNHCLVQITGTLDHPFYRLHPLTAIFLRTDLIGRWEEAEVRP